MSDNEREETAKEANGSEVGMGDINTDFNLQEDFKPDPLVPNGTYFGNVIEVKMDTEKGSVNWKVALDGNGGFKSDGETPIDGSHLWFRNWLPKRGDENIHTSSGSGNKFQSKVNMLRKFADGMKIDMNTITSINESIMNAEWIGLQVAVKVSISEYPKGSGNYKNDADTMIAL